LPILIFIDKFTYYNNVFNIWICLVVVLIVAGRVRIILFSVVCAMTIIVQRNAILKTINCNIRNFEWRVIELKNALTNDDNVLTLKRYRFLQSIYLRRQLNST
jgi:hypothetical protein